MKHSDSDLQTNFMKVESQFKFASFCTYRRHDEQRRNLGGLFVWPLQSRIRMGRLRHGRLLFQDRNVFILADTRLGCIGSRYTWGHQIQWYCNKTVETSCHSPLVLIAQILCCIIGIGRLPRYFLF